MFSKKGVSPLIATVLLLAFAVALATVIIQLKPFSNCVMEGVKFETNENGKPIICYDQATGEIHAFIFNDDERPITGFRVAIVGNKNVVNIASLEQPIGKKEVKKISIPYDLAANGEIISMKLIPQIDRINKPEECNMEEEIATIPVCLQ